MLGAANRCSGRASTAHRGVSVRDSRGRRRSRVCVTRHRADRIRARRRGDAAGEDHPRPRERVEGDAAARPRTRDTAPPLRGAGAGGRAAHAGGRRRAVGRALVAASPLRAGEADRRRDRRIGGDRPRRSATRAAAHHASSVSGRPMANEHFRQARRLLAAEIAASRGIEPEAADAWIVQQVAHAMSELTAAGAAAAARDAPSGRLRRRLRGRRGIRQHGRRTAARRGRGLRGCGCD